MPLRRSKKDIFREILQEDAPEDDQQIKRVKRDGFELLDEGP